jgi:hypothetical protein
MTEQFHYSHNGRQIVLPPLGNVKAGLIRRIRKLPADDQLFTLIEELADDEALAVVDDLAGDEFNEFLSAWQEFSGVKLGESGASSTT